MKPFLFLLTFLSLFSSLPLCASADKTSPAQQPQQFINPIFNERLIGITRFSNGWDTFLTPSHIIYVRDDIPNAANHAGECQMIDQTPTRVLMKCVKNDPRSYTYPKPYISYDLYISTGQGNRSKGFCGVVLYFTSIDKPNINTQDFKNFNITHLVVNKEDCGPFENID